MKIYNSKIYIGTQGFIAQGWVETEYGIITNIGVGEPDEINTDDINANGYLLTPGFIDAHTHLGIIESGLGFEGDDCNEVSDPFAPQLRALDAINHRDLYFKSALSQGFTTVASAPGSANPCGGQICAIKTDGTCVDDMLIKTVGIKFALGENPKTVYNDRDESPNTRMGTVAIIREGLFKAQRYLQQIENAKENDEDPPEFDMKSEALIPLLKREIKAHFHCHRADDICTAIRIIKEFKLDGVIVHGTEAHLIPNVIKKSGVPVITGPTFCDRGKPEMASLTEITAKVMSENGIPFAICSDHPVIPINHLMLSLFPMIRCGTNQSEMVSALTNTPAEILGIDDMVGSIELEKAADLVLSTKLPFDPFNSIGFVMINGDMKYFNKDIMYPKKKHK